MSLKRFVSNLNMLCLLLSFFLICEIRCFDTENVINLPEDTFRNSTEIISSKGYPVEDYMVQTPDGYLLLLQRIPHGKTKSSRSGKPVVFLLHPFLSDSTIWVLNDEKQSLGFLLADQGYDVWLGNVRGRSNNRRNVRLSPDQVEFWNFSYDEMALYDLPTMIDFTLKKTGQQQLSYIGHSQGCTVALALLSTSPEYNKKINFFIAMAPVAYADHFNGLLGRLMPFILAIQPFYKEIGLVEIFPHNRLTELLSVFVCGTPLREICAEISSVTLGRDEKELNYTRLPTYANHFPAGSSTKEYIHFAQTKYSGKFQMYDYYDRNQQVYGQPTPPIYDLSKITTPVAVLSATNDVVADSRDVAKAKSELKSLVESYVVPLDSFNHGDFLIAVDAYELVNKKVLSLLERYGQM